MNSPGIYMRLRASTLAEMLVVILVSGIVFAAAADGLGIFRRFSGQLTRRITENGRFRENYYLLEHIVTSADSLTQREGRITAYYAGEERYVLHQRDSSLLVQDDTLFGGVASLRAFPSAEEGTLDSIVLSLVRNEGRVVEISFSAAPPRHIVQRQTILQTESDYEYE